MHGDLRHLRFDDTALEAAVEVARLDRGAMAGGEYQAGFDPGIPGALPLGVLLFLAEFEGGDAQVLAEFEGGDAQVDERQRCLGGLGLDLAAMQLVTDPLDLLTDIKVGGVEVDQIPGQTEDFTPAQPHNEDQDEGGIQGLTGPARVFQKPAGFINAPPAPPAFARGRQLDHGSDVAADNFLIDGAGERSPERIAGIVAAYATAGEPEQAYAVIADLIAIADGLGSARVAAQIAELRTALTPWRRSPAVTDLLRRLETFKDPPGKI
jgi:hypothetical protein